MTKKIEKYKVDDFGHLFLPKVSDHDLIRAENVRKEWDLFIGDVDSKDLSGKEYTEILFS